MLLRAIYHAPGLYMKLGIVSSIPCSWCTVSWRNEGYATSHLSFHLSTLSWAVCLGAAYSTQLTLGSALIFLPNRNATKAIHEAWVCYETEVMTQNETLKAQEAWGTGGMGQRRAPCADFHKLECLTEESHLTHLVAPHSLMIILIEQHCLKLFLDLPTMRCVDTPSMQSTGKKGP